jgi:hypothetical protein
MHAPRGVLHMACASHATERRAAGASGSSSVADIPVWHRRLMCDWHGEAPRIFESDAGERCASIAAVRTAVPRA